MLLKIAKRGNNTAPAAPMGLVSRCSTDSHDTATNQPKVLDINPEFDKSDFKQIIRVSSYATLAKRGNNCADGIVREA